MMTTLNKKSSGGNIKSGVNNHPSGIRNFVKVKSLYYLWMLKVAYDNVPEFPYRRSMAMASDIAKWAKVNVKSLRVLLARWREASWGYVDAGWFPGECTNDGRGHWVYRLNNRGVHYLDSVNKWYSRSKEAKEETLNSGLLVHNEDTGEDEFHGAPTDILKPIAWLPEGSVFEVMLSYPFAKEVDIKPFPTAEAIRLCGDGKKEIRIIGEYGIRAHSAKEAFELITANYRITPSIAFQKLAIVKEKDCIAHTKHLIAKKYGIKVA